jgi:hypothetical protein
MILDMLLQWRRLGRLPSRRGGRMHSEGPSKHGFPTELWTLQRVGEVVRRKFGATYDQSGIWHVLRRLNGMQQKPERPARNRDEKAIQAWRSREWPRIKKRFVTAGPLFLWMNRASCSSPRFARCGLREARRRSSSATIGAAGSRTSRPSASRRNAAAWACCSTSSTIISWPRTSISSTPGCCARFAAPSPSSSTGSALTAPPCDPCRRGTPLDSKSSGCLPSLVAADRPR